MSQTATQEASQPVAVPPIVDQETWDAALADLRAREKAATQKLDAIAAARRRLPMVELPDYTLEGADGPVRLVDVFEGTHQLIVYNHMWFPGEEWQCPGCTGFTSQFTRLEFLDNYDARFVIVTQGPIEDALAYKAGGEQDDVVLDSEQLLRRRHGCAARRRLPGQRVHARRRQGVPDLQHPGARHGAARSQLRPHRPPAIRAPGRVAGLPEGGRSRRPTAGGRPRRSSPATPTDGPQAARQLITGGFTRAQRGAALVGQRERGDQRAVVCRVGQHPGGMSPTISLARRNMTNEPSGRTLPHVR